MEKEKETKDAEGFIEIPFGASDSESMGWTYTIPEGFTAKIEDGKIIVEKRQSEDERIRSCIVTVIKIQKEGSLGLECNHGATWNEMLAYLEKQKEPKLKVIIPKFRVGDIVKSISQPSLSPDRIQSIGQDCYWTEHGCIGFAWEHDYELVNQQPAEWSEEEIVNWAYDNFRVSSFDMTKIVTNFSSMDELERSLRERLKSLRPQPHWTPSEEQMKIFNEAIEHYSKYWDSEDIKILCSLYDDIKKLM